ncbi:prostamide/prostaglandin F synthase-like [Lineus longissimus]|uniref:prostamide/prostaglandin F synthase-like n=1 Tax=Lineus longissimus TaxID=88925 RepID=UPI00315D6FAE
MCRAYSRQLSALKPQLDANNVRMIGIGLEELGVEEFVEGKFFDGELYIDMKKESFKTLNFRRYNIFTVIKAIFTDPAKKLLAWANNENIKGNMSGDGFQNGGTLIVQAGGTKQLLFYKQEDAAQHVPLEDVLKALGIEEKAPKAEGASSGQKEVVCEEDVCKIVKK